MSGVRVPHRPLSRQGVRIGRARTNSGLPAQSTAAFGHNRRSSAHSPTKVGPVSVWEARPKLDVRGRRMGEVRRRGRCGIGSYNEPVAGKVDRTVDIVDTTLRDGEQAPGIAFSAGDKMEIAGLLADAGVGELEVGVPAMGRREVEAIRAVAQMSLPATLSVWARAIDADIEIAAMCDVPNVHVAYPASKLQLEVTGYDEQWLVSHVDRFVHKAREHFDGVSVGAIDATRADPGLLVAFAAAASSAGARRIRIADTVGVGSPLLLSGLFDRLLTAVPLADFEFHGHNDLGLATANALIAVDAGASAVSVTVNGLGERAGNAPLEEVVVALKLLCDIESGVDFVKLQHLCESVAERSGRIIPESKPIAGPGLFTHESGIHVAGLVKNPYAYQPFLPDSVGAGSMQFVAGKHSGSHALWQILAEQGLTTDRAVVSRLLPEVRRLAESRRRALTAAELVELYSRDSGGEPHPAAS